MDPITLNIKGVDQLVKSGLNKTKGTSSDTEGVVSEYVGILELKMSDNELINLSKKWEETYKQYESNIEKRQKANKAYYLGKSLDNTDVQSSPNPQNLIFEATETFIPQAMAKNPEPVVWSDNTEEGKKLSDNVKLMLQYHADVLVLRSKLSLMVRHWSMYFIAAIKHGWDNTIQDIKSDIINPKNLIFDINGYVDVSGNFEGEYIGERKKCTAEQLIEMFPEKKEYIVLSVEGKLGTRVSYTEWWTDKYCFYTYMDVVLDKQINPLFNYIENTDEFDQLTNHFSVQKMPYTFLSVFSTGESPHDVTNLIEQNISNQDIINKRLKQIDKNIDSSNNSIAFSADNFTEETAKQASQAMLKGNPVLVPTGESRTGIVGSIQRFPAPGLPNDFFSQLNIMSENLRSIYGTQGIGSPGQSDERTVRGKIINQQLDSSRIGGGIGDKLEQVADTIFNWWVQLYQVFYDVEHEARILGKSSAIEYSVLKKEDFDRRIVVSVSPGSMKPRDEITEMNLAVDRWNNKSIDPIELMKKLNEPDPIESAKKLVLWTTNPQEYYMQYLGGTSDMTQQTNTGTEQEQDIPPSIEGTLSAEPPNPSISQVDINQGVSMPE